MSDPWELLDKTANIIEVSGLIYLIYRNRGLLIRRGQQLRATVTDHLGISDHAERKVHRIELKATVTGTASLTGVVKGRSSASGVLSVVQNPAALEELLLWYLRVR